MKSRTITVQGTEIAIAIMQMRSLVGSDTLKRLPHSGT
jgi:hypothetical protein